MNHIVKNCILCISIGILVLSHCLYASSAYIPKIQLPEDSRPFPKTYAQWKKVQQMPDPLAAVYPTTSGALLGAKHAQSSPIPWNKLQWGDILVGRGKGKNIVPYGYFRHAGMWHAGKKMILSAMPKEGVCFQSTALWAKDLPRLEFLMVTQLTLKQKETITVYGARQLGKPYAFSAKGTCTSWYCSKLPWACYKGQGVNLDPHGFFLVAPDSLYHSKHTKSIYRKFG